MTLNELCYYLNKFRNKVNKDINENLYLHHATNSIYDENQDRRFIPGKEVNKSQWAREINDIGRNSIDKSESALEEKGLIKILPNGDREIIPVIDKNGKAKSRFIILDHKVVESMYHILTSNGSKILIYLWNNYQYWNLYMKKPFCFSKSQIATSIGLSPQTKNLRMVEDNLSLLVVNGIIGYSIVKKGNSVYRRLNWMNIKKPLTSAVSDKVEEITINYAEPVFIDMPTSGGEEMLAEVGYDLSVIEKLQEGAGESLYLTE